MTKVNGQRLGHPGVYKGRIVWNKGGESGGFILGPKIAKKVGEVKEDADKVLNGAEAPIVEEIEGGDINK